MLKMLIKYLHSRSYSELDIRIEGKIRNYKVRFVDSDVLWWCTVVHNDWIKIMKKKEIL